MPLPAIFGTHEPNTIGQLLDVASRAEKAALMADGHLGYVMPIGGVAAYDNQVSVVGVGFDIACGNCAIQTNLLATRFNRQELEHIADQVQDQISFGVGRKNKSDDAPINHPLFDDIAWEALPSQIQEPLRDKARSQLGTVGSGNHYVDILVDELGYLWVGVHFGSRGLGHSIASGFLALSQNQQWGARVPEKETLLDLSSSLGSAYWTLMELAGQYAYAGREWVARKVVSILGGEEISLVHNHHNFAWHEKQWIGDSINGEERELIVVRKGATPAFPNQKGFVGGSMGDDAVILCGADAIDHSEFGDADFDLLELQHRAMFSTVHGAGRVMGRIEAKGKVKKGRVVKEGKITQDMMDDWISSRGVILRGGGLDESPHVYRRLPDVLQAQGPTVVIEHKLKPIIVVMAGANEFDPYKD